jgi:hypothetical protein
MSVSVKQFGAKIPTLVCAHDRSFPWRCRPTGSSPAFLSRTPACTQIEQKPRCGFSRSALIDLSQRLAFLVALQVDASELDMGRIRCGIQADGFLQHLYRIFLTPAKGARRVEVADARAM